MHKLRDVFFIESPLQLSSAKKAREHFNIKNAVLFINIKNKGDTNHSQILKGLDNDNGWPEINFIYRKSNILENLQFLLFTFRLFINYKGNINRFFYGDHRSPNYAIFQAILKPKEAILLDDGAVTIAVQKNYIRKNKDILTIEGLRLKLFSFILNKPRVPNLYSFFDLERYLLPEQTNYFEKKEVCQIKTFDSIYFLGSKLSESGYMKESDEIKVLTSIYESYPSLKLYYVPHRDESSCKLEKIKGLGYELLVFDKPIERFYEKSLEMPKIVMSYYSTALYTCYLNFGHQVELIAVDIRRYLNNKMPINNVNTVYEYYEDLGIKIDCVE